MTTCDFDNQSFWPLHSIDFVPRFLSPIILPENCSNLCTFPRRRVEFRVYTNQIINTNVRHQLGHLHMAKFVCDGECGTESIVLHNGAATFGVTNLARVCQAERVTGDIRPWLTTLIHTALFSHNTAAQISPGEQNGRIMVPGILIIRIVVLVLPLAESAQCCLCRAKYLSFLFLID